MYDAVDSQGFPSLDGIEVTKAVIHRMQSYGTLQSEIKRLLNKRIAAAASDFFLELILFFLSLYCRSVDRSIEVHSERPIKPIRGQLRPDISIWKNDEVVAVVECKTQLGWTRDNWENDFKDREQRLLKVFPRARAFLLVMSEGNWGGFAQHQGKVGKQYFALLKHGVKFADITDDNLREKITNSLEELLAQLPLL